MMGAINDPSPRGKHTFLEQIVAVERHEVAALVASFAMFFSLLAGYYIIRPLRDDMGVIYGKDDLHHLFTFVFLVMLAALPAFGYVASRVPRRLVLPAVYGFFIVCLLSFWLVLSAAPPSKTTAATFFIWGSVFNLFLVSLFWSLMSELWATDEAKRLYGFISAGGTAGALLGPVITQVLIRIVAPANLLLVAALLFAVALSMSFILRRLHPSRSGHETEPAGGSRWDGAKKVFSDPFFARIALFILLANVVGTFFYMEQTRLAADFVEGGSAERLKFFSARDLIVSIATLTIEVFGTATILRRLGLTVALLALPTVALVNTLAITWSPVLYVVAAALIAERVIAYSLSSPAIKVMYTLAKPDEKYKVQSFIDTVVYRGGDAAAGWIFAILSAGLGFTAAAVPALTLPLVLLWLWNGRALGRAYEARVGHDVENDAQILPKPAPAGSVS